MRLKEYSEYLIGIIVIALIYYALARFGFGFSTVHQNITLIWPASGVSVGILFLFGMKYFPAITIGAFFANFHSGVPLVSSAAISLGNTMEALLAVFLMKLFFDNSKPFSSLPNIGTFIFFGAFISPSVSAIIGSVCLLISDSSPIDKFPWFLGTWWIGDLSGILVFAPPFLAWKESQEEIRQWNGRKIAEYFGLLILLLLFIFVLFGGMFPQPYLLFPVLILISVRRGICGSILSIIVVSLLALLFTSLDSGPFGIGLTDDRLFQLQTFLVIVGTTFLVLGSVVSEGNRSLVDRRNAITEKIETQEKIRKQDAVFKAIVDNASEIIGICNAHGEFFYYAPSIFTVLGYSPEERLGKTILDIIHPGDRDLTQRKFAELANNRRSHFRGVVRLRHNAGDWIFVDCSAQNLLHDSAIMGVLVHAVDITEKIIQENALRESEERFRKAFEGAPVGMFLVNLQGKFFRSNKAWCNMIGYSATELETKTTLELTFPDDIHISESATLQLRRSLTESGTSEYPNSLEKRYIHKSGRVIEAQVNYSIINNINGQPEYYITQVIDITKKNAAERALRESEQKWRSLVENAPNYIMTIDKNGTILYINQTVPELKIEDVTGTAIHLYNSPEEGERLKQFIDHVFETGENVHFELGRSNPDGKKVWFSTRIGPIEKDGKIDQVILIATDITEMKEVENALRESEERWRSVVLNAPNFITTVDRNGTILFMNQVIPGFSLDEITGTSIYELNLHDEVENLRRNIEHVFETGETVSFELRGPGPTGISWYSSRIGPVKVDGIVEGAIIIATDITSIKEAEDALRESEERWRSLVVNAPNYILTLDNEGTILFLNRKPSDLESTLFVGSSIYDYLTKVEADSIKNNLDTVFLTGKQVNLEVSRQGEENLVIWYSATIGPIIKGGKVEGAILIASDITEIKQIENALRESKETLAQAAEVASLGNWQFEIATGAITWSDELYKIFGFEPQEFPVTQDFYYPLVHPDDIEKLRKEEELIGTEKKLTSRFEYRIIRKDGSIRHTTTILTMIYGRDGELVKIFATMQDITDLKSAEENLRRLNLELEQRVQDRTSQLEAAYKELESYSYSVSHDLRAPLRAIDGFSRCLLEEYQDILDETGKGYLQRVMNATKRMEGLIADLLNISFITRSPVDKNPVDLSWIANTLASELKSSDPQRNVHFIIQDNLKATVDERLFKIVLQNLLGNAFKYSSKIAKAEIRFELIGSDPGKVFCISDNGAGFDMAYYGKLFGPFQRLHTVSEFEGSGIGLATVQRIIMKHGGKIWAESEVGKGARFYFSLPEIPLDNGGIYTI